VLVNIPAAASSSEEPVVIPRITPTIMVQQPKTVTPVAIAPKPVMPKPAAPAAAAGASPFQEIKIKAPAAQGIVKFKIAKPGQAPTPAATIQPKAQATPLVPNAPVIQPTILAPAPAAPALPAVAPIVMAPAAVQAAPVIQASPPVAAPPPAVVPAGAAAKPENQGPAIQIAEVNQTSGIFKFYCPACQQKLGAKINWQGRSINCPACSTAITIPAL
jgi:hypothetical protein